MADRRRQGEYPPLCGGLVLFQREYLQLLGGWDERFVGWGGEDDAMSLKVARAAMPSRIMAGAAHHLHHRRAAAGLGFVRERDANLALLAQLEAMSEASLKRFCEVAWQLAGDREMYRPQGARA